MSAPIRSATSEHSSTNQVSPSAGRLPLELWRVVLSYLSVDILSHCSQVCRSWKHLVESLDNTTWKRHFLASRAWREPGWPICEWNPAWTWQGLYREHQLHSRMWSLPSKQTANNASCMPLGRRRRQHRVLHVGPYDEHRTLKSALAVAGEYDRIIIAPGTYDEQFEMSSKIPFELVGSGKLGSTVLIMCVEQHAITGRLCNLVIKAPWFTTQVIKVLNGHLQMDNCRIEDGQVVVHSAGTCHFRYCTFSRLQLSLVQTRISLIENCEFINSTSTALCIEGLPTEDTNWAHEHLSLLVTKLNTATSSPDSTTSSNASDLGTKSIDGSRVSLRPEGSLQEVDSIGVASIAGSQASLSEVASLAPSFESSVSSHTLPSRGRISRPEDFYSDQSQIPVRLPKVKGHVPLPILDLTDSDCSSSCDSTTVIPLSSSCGQLSSLWSDGEEKYMEDHLQDVLQESLYTDPSLVDMVLSTNGPVVRECRFQRCHGGVTVSRQGQLRLEKCHLYDMQYGVRCLQNAKVAVLENTIHHCTTSGIFMRLAAHGLIAGNDIYCTSEAGIDVRKSADPLIQCNKIHHSKRSGIVVLGSGHGTITSNDIYQNKEAGIYILYRGNPHVSGNRIVHGGAAGIAISEEGRGYITENLISRNRWGGVDIRHGGDPCITNNLICNGLADGVVIGHRGKGTIEGNTMKGNAGCGMWVMGGQPLIRMNQIYNNNDTGVSFIHNKDNAEDFSADEVEDSQSDQSIEVENFLAEIENDGYTANTQITHPQLLYNTIYHNKGYGVLAQSTELLHVSGNAVHANRNIGVNIQQSLPVTVLNNSITCNAGIGLQVAAEAKVKIEGNGIYDNSNHGVLVQGEASIHDNDIFSNQMAALVLQGQAEVMVSKNRIHSPKDCGLSIADGVRGRIHDNKLYEGSGDLITDNSDSAECSILDNNIINYDKIDGERIPSPDWHLEDPPPRPHITAPPAIVPRSPVRHVTTVTRLVVPSTGSCQHGSKLCVIL